MVLALLSAIGPIATDLYLASFPAIRAGLHTDAAATQLTLTAFLIGLGVGQFLWGPVLDRFGRLRPLLIGSAVATIAAAVTVFAPTIQVLIAARLIQALAAAAGVVAARAVIADRLRGFGAANALSLMTTISSVAPVAAPVAGGALAGHVSWRGVLGVIAGLTLLQLIGVVTTVRETLPADRRATRLGYGTLGHLLRRPAFLGYALTQAFAFGVLMSYISNSSFVYQSVLGVNGLVYGLGFAVNAIGIMAGGATSTRLARRRVHPAVTVGRALRVLVIASAGVLFAALSPWPALLLIPLLVVTTSFGFVLGNCTALAVEHGRDAAGTASAAIGGLTFLTGALVSPVGGLISGDSAVPMGCLMLGASIPALVCFQAARRYVSRHPQSETAYSP